MASVNVQELEKTKAGFSEDLFFQIRDRSFEAIKKIHDRIQVGMLEEDANQMAIDTLQEIGTPAQLPKPQ